MLTPEITFSASVCPEKLAVTVRNSAASGSTKEVSNAMTWFACRTGYRTSIRLSGNERPYTPERLHPSRSGTLDSRGGTARLPGQTATQMDLFSKCRRLPGNDGCEQGFSRLARTACTHSQRDARKGVDR